MPVNGSRSIGAYPRIGVILYIDPKAAVMAAVDAGGGQAVSSQWLGSPDSRVLKDWEFLSFVLSLARVRGV